MNDKNGKNINDKDNDLQRFKDFFNSYNEVSETDEVLNQLLNFNFGEENSKLKNNNEKSILKEIKFEITMPTIIAMKINLFQLFY